jgi:transcriptional regulator with XRE-family HTH domain
MITPEQSRAARALIGWTQTELAAASNLSMSTIRDFERGQRVPTVNNLAAIRRALEEAGIELLDGDEPGVKLRKREPTPA